MRSEGKFITFEGPEKSGKSTQAELLLQYLKSKGYDVVFAREPGSTKIGEKIRQILLDKKNTRMSLITEMLLYMSARAQLVEEVIKPALTRGGIVLCDRFQDSTICYQGFGCGLDTSMINKIGLVATDAIKPHLTLLLDFWKSDDHLKNQKNPDRIEMRSDLFHRKVKKGYFYLAKKEPGRIKIIEVEDDLNKTQIKIRKAVEKCLLKK